MPYKIQNITAQIIYTLYSDGNLDKAVLASARSCAAITDQKAQKVWPIMLASLNDNMLSRTGEPTYSETAIYSAIHFYAIYQQGKEALVYGNSGSEVSDDGLQLFQTLANLRKRDETRVALDRRVQAILGTTNITSLINGLTHLIEILKSNYMSNNLQKIDFAKLASDLYKFQLGYEYANEVRLIWGQQYFRTAVQSNKSEGDKG
ncbi:MAG: type I-E CRISPR-associated protein Cse2/CasB [Liquorilactobacillus ghanensis]|uniref:type I-E CRISPR-associated protein Cse2/CasB n=1 Tax=Liquorilactobacillus ghanensis TaxID=399370 RepID=UPI0039E76BA5